MQCKSEAVCSADLASGALTYLIRENCSSSAYRDEARSGTAALYDTQAEIPVDCGAAKKSRLHRSKGTNRSNTEIVGSNPIRGTDVSLFCVCVVLSVGSGLATG
jgi:hypothetical protein